MAKSSVKESVHVSRSLRQEDKTVLPPLRPKTPKALPPLPRTPGGRRKFAKDTQLRCGVVQIIGGIGALVLGVGAIVAGSGGAKRNTIGTNSYASGIWGGFIMIIAGITGIVSSKNEKTISIKACLVCSVLSVLCSFIFMALSINMLATDSSTTYYKSGTISTVTDTTVSARINIDIVSTVVGLMVLVVAIIQCAVCGRALEYESSRKRDKRVFFVAQPMPDGYVKPVKREGAVVIIPAGTHQHPRPNLPPNLRDDSDKNIPSYPPPRYQDQMRE